MQGEICVVLKTVRRPHYERIIKTERKVRTMKSTGIVRNIDELGRIVIPKEIRTNMDIKHGDPVEIFIDGEKIILSKYHPSCLFCGEMDDVVVFKGKKICRNCLKEMTKSL